MTGFFVYFEAAAPASHPMEIFCAWLAMLHDYSISHVAGNFKLPPCCPRQILLWWKTWWMSYPARQNAGWGG